MQESDDNALLRKYAESGSDEAFAALVERHVNKVYSAALRHTGNPDQAGEITQSVFVLLASKAKELRKDVILAGWLYETARLKALTLIRGNIRRASREQEAHMQSNADEDQSTVWQEIAPLLDAAIGGLNETDRHAVVLRFFYGKSMREVGSAIGSSEGAATLRIHRVLEKLREFFVKHGVNSTSDAIAGAILANSVQPAPAMLAKSIVAGAIKGAAAGGKRLAFTKMATWLKTTTLAVAVANALLSQKIVATHFDFAGNPNGWMTQSESSLTWLFGFGLPLIFVAVGYAVRFLPKDYLNLPDRDYWLAPERQEELFQYWFRQFLWMALFSAIFVLTQILLQIEANRHKPPHLSTPAVLAAAVCYTALIFVWLARMARHFNRTPNAPGFAAARGKREKYWFPAKKIGWGWGPPCAWQGWVVLACFVMLFYGSTSVLKLRHPLVCVATNLFLGAVLVVICWAKGEKPGGGNRGSHGD